MEFWNPMSDSLVDAIEEGRIVRVPEQYAKREGLTILRKSLIEQKEKIQQKVQKQDEIRPSLDELRKPLSYKKNQVASELIENFQWEIAKTRRQKSLSRRQFAKMINEPESLIKLLENGIVPGNDFIIINKIQSVLNINLRKDKKDFAQSARSLLNEEKAKEISPQEKPRMQLKSNSKPFDPFRYKHTKSDPPSIQSDSADSSFPKESKSSLIKDDIELIE